MTASKQRGSIDDLSRVGKVTIDPGLNVWPHELRTAQALAAAGYAVRFVPRSEGEYVRTPDVLIEGELWEMKAPKSDKVAMIRKNLRRAMHQSLNVVFDSRRMKRLPNAVIERAIRVRASEMRSLEHLFYIRRSGEVLRLK